MSDDPDEQEKESEPSTATSQELVAQYEQNKDLRRLLLTDGNYTDVKAALVGARLDGVEMFRAILQRLDLTDATMVGANARRVIFTSAILKRADLRNAVLTNADLQYADLTDADLRGCRLAGAKLTGAIVSGMKIDRHALRMLGDGHGGLTDADLATLKVEDDQSKITTSFGGFWTALHLIAVLIFLLPYVVFGVNRYVAAKMSSCTANENCVTLREALLDYIITGGKGSEIDIIAISIFLLLLAYNTFRISLVYKARSLDLAERASGMPRKFTLSGYWRVAYYGCQWLVWVNLILVVIHAYNLLDMKVPPLA